MIVGLGTDIVEINRIDKVVAKAIAGSGLAKCRLALRILTPSEQVIFNQSTQPARYLAKRFAAKEAAAKALGTGIGRGVSFQHIEVSNNENGAPQLTLSAGAAERMQQLGAQHVHISIADEAHYATATVVIS
ncbi:holo-ACP synthase [Shewanella waksmanii]|uniref:holo-ACP synthase n=1 Tax=Shewanella waksmanii TaxID=213783 RepID=UPI003736B3BF